MSPQFAEAENARIEQLGIETEPAQSHTGLAQQGLKKLREVLKAQLRECYPYLPGQAVDRIMEYLVSPDTLVNVAYQMGLQPLVFRAGQFVGYNKRFLFSEFTLNRPKYLSIIVSTLLSPQEPARMSLLSFCMTQSWR